MTFMPEVTKVPGSVPSTTRELDNALVFLYISLIEIFKIKYFKEDKFYTESSVVQGFKIYTRKK